MEQLIESKCSGALGGTHILVVEDNFLILMELEATVAEAGAATVWTCRTVREAMDVLAGQAVNVAIIDFQLDRETSEPLARELAGRGIPFCFYTGQLDVAAVNAHWPQCSIVSKPAMRHTIVEAVRGLIAARLG